MVVRRRSDEEDLGKLAGDRSGPQGMKTLLLSERKLALWRAGWFVG